MYLIVVQFFLIHLLCANRSEGVSLSCSVRVSEVIFHGTARINSSNGLDYCSFMGIPFAQPPVGKLRFEPPQPVLYSDSTEYHFKRQSEICLQPDDTDVKAIGSEDCLYLNVFTPELRPKQLMPVLFWIHGGSMNVGSAYSDDVSPDLFVEQKIVFVTANYRLGALGFLSLPKYNISGNYGLLDQQAALQWVKRYIKAFGGDPDRVTAIGWSAGAASVSYHLYAPSSKGLFQQAIAMSGSLLNPWAFNQQSKFFNEMLCSKKQDDCAKKFYSTCSKYFVLRPFHWFYKYFEILVFCFLPTIDGQLISDSPAAITAYNPIVNDVPLLIGYTSMEIPMLPKRPTLKIEQTATKEQRLANQYLANITDDAFLLSLRNIIDIRYGVRELANIYSQKSTKNVFFYEFSFSGLFNPESMEEKAAHGDDIKYLFRTNIKNPKQFESDLRVQRKMIKMWSNFIKYGNPTPKASKNFFRIWPPFSENGTYMNIGKRLLVKNMEFDEPYILWNAIYKCLHLQDCNLLRQFLEEKGFK